MKIALEPIGILSTALLITCIVSCGKQSLNRVQPKTEVIYTRDPCSKGSDEVSDKMDSGSNQGSASEILTDPIRPGESPEDAPAEGSGMGDWPPHDGPSVLGRPDGYSGKADKDLQQN